jgi:hypothetical protein
MTISDTQYLAQWVMLGAILTLAVIIVISALADRRK